MFRKKYILVIGTGVLSLGLSIAFAFWLIEFSAKEYIEYITVKNDKVYVLKTTHYESEDGPYTKNKLIVLNQNYEKVQEVKLIKEIKKITSFENNILFFNVDEWHRVKEYIKVNYTTLHTEVINQEALEKTLFRQGISNLFYIDGLLKITDKNGYIHYLNPENFANYGTATNEYELRQKHLELNTLTQNQETVSDAYISRGGYTLYYIEQNKGTERKKVCKKDNSTNQNHKIIVGFFSEKELQEEVKREEKKLHCTETDFLQAQFIGASLSHNIILVLSFRNTDQQEAIIHCFDKNLNPVWQKTNIDLHLDISSVKHTTFSANERHIFLSSKNKVIIADKENGNVIKQLKL